MRIKRVYIASPYTLGNKMENVNRQIDAANELIKAGFSPLCPLLNHFIHEKHPHSYETWMQIDLDWLETAHAVLRLSGQSSGADKEALIACGLKIPVFLSVDEIVEANK